jgi:DNA anti-recombination protein RmuC
MRAGLQDWCNNYVVNYPQKTTCIVICSSIPLTDFRDINEDNTKREKKMPVKRHTHIQQLTLEN